MRAALILAAITIAGLLLAWQGWRHRGPDADVVASMVRTVALVDRGVIPHRGNLTDHNSFRPPGLSWLLVPGVALFNDPRVVELASCAALYAGTIAGIVALGARLFSRHAALLAAALYGFSAIGIYLASTMQPKAYPLFGVWMAYAVIRWVGTRDARWLAVACVVCSAGAYVHLEMLALAVMLPVAWWMTRAPLSPGWLVVAALVALTMWAPYLRFQFDRGFVDLQSQVFLQRVDLRGLEAVPMCGEEPTASPRFVSDRDVGLGITGRLASAVSLSAMNFSTRVPLGRVVLVLLFGAGAFAALRSTPELRVLALATLLPMTIIAVLAEPGVPRMLALWPLQVLLLLAPIGRLRQPGPRLVAGGLVLLTLSLNPETMTRLRALPSQGWSGVEPAVVDAAQFRTVRCPDERAPQS